VHRASRRDRPDHRRDLDADDSGLLHAGAARKRTTAEDLTTNNLEPVSTDEPTSVLEAVPRSRALTASNLRRCAVGLGSPLRPPEFQLGTLVRWVSCLGKARRRARHLRPSLTREEFLKRAREDETVAHMYEWLTSPGLQPPE